MSAINNATDTQIKNEINSDDYELPAVIREDKNEISFEKALVISVLIHIGAFFIIMLTMYLCELLGINLALMKKPELNKDIEFVLVEKEAEPINKNTKYRADINSRAGGQHDPSKKVSLPQVSAPKNPAPKPTPPAPEVKKQPVKQPKPQQSTAPQQPSKPVKTQEAQKPSAPKPSAPKPTATSVQKPTTNPASGFNIPVPKSAIPNVAPGNTSAPVTSSPSAIVSSSSGSGRGSSASPSFSPTTSRGGTGTGAGGGGRFSNGTGSGSNTNAGNPGPGNPKGAPGIDAVKEPDFGPYMKELQRRIKMNWDPPKGDQSKRVVLLFSIAKDGRLLNVSVHKSSGLPAADKAAIDAVKLTAPFRPLPPDFKGKSVDIQFTFDYNVFGVSG